ncbi:MULTISPECIES: NADPH-dependent FMN reductase [Gordonia]|uniref:NADPH-dependent FMN reductase n=1 Tax=Gordonia TaxID=2053 RepID=UPI0007E960A2|nr:NAD(P)H-dependent oxidoreductase [Gordonia sp. 852002-50395_SCH5434458]OBC03815.1 FMN reductase [Gordonia sp. 852002-50395_SCH5434458]
MPDHDITAQNANVTVAVLVGSLRSASINKQLAESVVRNAPAGIEFSVVENIGRVPFYNEDVDHAPGSTDGVLDPEVVALRERVAAADAVLIVTPEYNGSAPAVLKNAIDWLSRPYGAGALTGKPVGVIGVALGRFGGTWSREDIRKSVKIAGGQVVEEVEFGVSGSQLDDSGRLPAEVIDGAVDAVRVLGSEVAVSV